MGAIPSIFVKEADGDAITPGAASLKHLVHSVEEKAVGSKDCKIATCLEFNTSLCPPLVAVENIEGATLEVDAWF